MAAMCVGVQQKNARPMKLSRAVFRSTIAGHAGFSSPSWRNYGLHPRCGPVFYDEVCFQDAGKDEIT
jgi:hypothetical protein